MELTGPFFDDTSKQGRKILKNDIEMKLWGTFGAALDGFWTHFACSDVTWQSLFRLFVESWATLCRKVGFRDFDATLEQKLSLCRSWRARWSHLRPKVTPERSKVASKGQSEWPGRSSLAGRFGFAVRVMETVAPRRNAAGNHIKPELKVYISDKTYD